MRKCANLLCGLSMVHQNDTCIYLEELGITTYARGTCDWKSGILNRLKVDVSCCT